MENAKSEIELIKKYQNLGYKDNFKVANDKLIDVVTKNEFSPKEVQIVAEHRFEGMSNPSDMSILYIIKIKEEVKGTFLASYGSATDTEAAEFFNEIPKENMTNEENILM